MAAEAVPTMLCMVCYDPFQSDDVLRCKQGHSLCRECLENSLKNLPTEEKIVNLKCIFPECLEDISTDPRIVMILAHTVSKSKSRFDAASFAEKRLNELEKALAELRMTRAQDPEEVKHITVMAIQKIQTLKCPCCDIAFYDFTGCLALRCGNCGTHFCCVCFADYGIIANPDAQDPVHKHIQKEHGDVFDMSLFKQSKLDRLYAGVSELTKMEYEKIDQVVTIASKMSDIPKSVMLTNLIPGLKDFKLENALKLERIKTSHLADIKGLERLLKEQEHEMRRALCKVDEERMKVQELEELLRLCNFATDQAHIQYDNEVAKSTRLETELAEYRKQKLHELPALEANPAKDIVKLDEEAAEVEKKHDNESFYFTFRKGDEVVTRKACFYGPECKSERCKRSGLFHQVQCAHHERCTHIIHGACSYYHSHAEVMMASRMVGKGFGKGFGKGVYKGFGGKGFGKGVYESEEEP